MIDSQKNNIRLDKHKQTAISLLI